ncbi:MAG: hypothetical protein WAU53_17975 [Rhodoplanes sp.]
MRAHQRAHFAAASEKLTTRCSGSGFRSFDAGELLFHDARTLEQSIKQLADKVASATAPHFVV